MPKVVIADLDKVGVISDIPGFQTAPNAWSSARNVSFENGGVSKAGNRSEIMIPAADEVNKIYNKLGKVYYGTENKVYQATGFLNVDISRTTGGAYLPTVEWFITELSNVLIFCNSVDVPQQLKPTDSKLSNLKAWGVEGGSTHTWTTPLIRAYKSFLICLGMIEDGTEYAQRIRWSDATLPNDVPASWDATSTTNSAGFNDLSEARGRPIEALVMGDNLIVYTSREVYVVSYVGGNNIFNFRKVFDDIQILAPECAVAIPGGHFVITTSDIIVHNGSSWSSVVTNKVKKELFTAVGRADPEAIKVIFYPAKNEVWVLYPSGKGYILDRAAIFSLDNQTWTFRELPNITSVSYGPTPGEGDRVIDTQTQIFNDDNQTLDGVGIDFVKGSLYAATSNLTWWAIDEGPQDADIVLPSAIIKNCLDFDDWGAEADSHKLIKGIYPQFDGRGVVNISVGVSDDPYSAPTWSEAVYFDIETMRKADFRMTGRYIHVRFEGFNSDQWTLLSYAIEGQIRGKR